MTRPRHGRRSLPGSTRSAWSRPGADRYPSSSGSRSSSALRSTTPLPNRPQARSKAVVARYSGRVRRNLLVLVDAGAAAFRDDALDDIRRRRVGGVVLLARSCSPCKMSNRTSKLGASMPILLAGLGVATPRWLKHCVTLPTALSRQRVELRAVQAGAGAFAIDLEAGPGRGRPKSPGPQAAPGRPSAGGSSRRCARSPRSPARQAEHERGDVAGELREAGDRLGADRVSHWLVPSQRGERRAEGEEIHGLWRGSTARRRRPLGSVVTLPVRPD